MIGLSGEIPLVSHSDVTSPFPPSGNGGYASNRDVCVHVSLKASELMLPANMDKLLRNSGRFVSFRESIKCLIVRRAAAHPEI